MIIGANKDLVIANIQEAAAEGAYNSKVEVDDPELSAEEKQKLVDRFLRKYKKLGYLTCNTVARINLNIVSRLVNRDTEIVGLENMKDVRSGAIITSNHFNPLDNTVVRTMTRKGGHRRLHIISQETNFAMKGFIGFMMNYADIVPISAGSPYMKKQFPAIVREILEARRFVLIYPEQEMWFNYRKPRPPKRGAYFYAAKFNVPIVSCFVEMIDLPEKETDEFYKVRYVMHVLPPIYPDTEKTDRENSVDMMNLDYAQKVAAYEEIYGKKLTYDYEKGDIAGWIEQDA